MNDNTSSVWEQTKCLLAKRGPRKWDSFSWIAFRPVISSVNDGVNRFAPTLVGELRQRWVSGQRADPDLIVERKEDTAFIVLGDPGEQDASQYVVVPALTEQAADVDFMVICSDVIYPSGDVNDYVDGFYVPYGSLVSLPILALPGNHDWYDGLTGFMWNFCGAEPLPASAFRPTASTPFREWPFRLLWRLPSKRDPRLGLDVLRDERAGGHWVPQQPGPYYAIQTRHVLLVCIDTGIDRTIDLEQGEWLLRVSARPGPKVLITGAPLVVDRESHPCCIRGGPVGPGDTGRLFHSVAEIVEYDDHGYVASIGGDIHNFQHYRVDRLHHIVSGGGGAYMSATHPIPVAVHDPCTPQPEVPPAEKMFPSAQESLRHFSRLLLPRVWRLVRTLIAVLTGVLAGAAALEFADPGSPPRRVAAWASLALGGFVLLRMFAIPSAWTRTAGYRFCVVVAAFLGGAGLVELTAVLSPDHALRYLSAWLGLTAAGGVLAMVLRLTAWWRPPSAGFLLPGQRRSSRWLWLLAAGFVLFPVIVLAPGHDPWLTGAAACTTVAAIGGWQLRWQAGGSAPRCGWKRWGPLLAYVVQGLDAVAVLWRIVTRDSLEILAGITAGLVLTVAVFVVSVLLLSAVLRLGHAQVWLLTPLEAGGLWAAWEVWGGTTAGYHAALVTAVFVSAVPIIAFGMDALRRRVGQSYKTVAAVIATVGYVVLLTLGAFDTWLPRAALSGAVIFVMAAITVVTLHLGFLGAMSLIWDRETHGVRDQLSHAEADRVIRWRAGGTRPPQRHVRRRANIAFPGTDQPHGPIQSAVSEIFDSDVPPFIKNFLVVKADEQELTVTAHVVTGTDSVPPPYDIKIRLQS
ncbi:MAG: hypothetical protein WCB04_11145 [Mycobacteriales bacterium]